MMPVTLPTPSTEPSDGLLLVHVPLKVASVNAIDDPVQTDAGPDINPGVGLMVITAVEMQVVGAV